MCKHFCAFFLILLSSAYPRLKMSVHFVGEIDHFSNKIRIYLGMSENCSIFAGQKQVKLKTYTL